MQVVKSVNREVAKPRKTTRTAADKILQKEIETHVRKIRTLIEKLPPRDRQDYFSGLLNHILTDSETPGKTTPTKDINKLSRTELVLLNELSVKMEELYRTMDY